MKRSVTTTLFAALLAAGSVGFVPGTSVQAQSATSQTQSAAQARVNLNTASEEELLTVPGVGPRVVKELLEYRPYTTKAQFEGELGKYLDAQAVADLEQNFTLGLVNLNTASEQELLTVPGVGPRVVKELLEYRPYTSWAQFERELGKYLEPSAVSDLEFYTTF